MLSFTVAHLSLLVLLAAPADVPAEDPFTISGVVVNSDGSPASNAKVTIVGNWPNTPIGPAVSSRCDEEGKFSSLTTRFGFTTIIHAVSEDERFQVEMTVPDFLARTVAAQAVRLQLKPTHEVKVTVTSEGEPVMGCALMIHRFPGSRQMTDEHGRGVVRFPPVNNGKTVTAFHPKFGLGSWRQDDAIDLPNEISIELDKPAPHTFIVRDQRGEPVPNFSFTPGVRINQGQWGTSAVPRLATGPQGIAKVSWMPVNYEYIDPITASTRWQVDERTSSGQETEVLVRKKHLFRGVVRFPDGKPRAGVLIVATSFGPSSRGDHSQARTDKTGRFHLHLAPDHAYVLGVRDPEWASETRGGVFLRTEGDSIEYTDGGTFLDAVPATRVTVRVLNVDGKPMENAWINFALILSVDWTDSDGKARRGAPRIHHWIRTDDSGVGSFGTVPGKVRIRVSKQGWSQTKELELSGEKPLDVTIQQEAPPVAPNPGVKD